MKFESKPAFVALYGYGDVAKGRIELELMAHDNPPKYTEPGLIGFVRVPDARATFAAIYYAIAEGQRRPMYNHKLRWTMKKSYAIALVESHAGALAKPPRRYLWSSRHV